MLDNVTCLKFYSRKDIQKEIVSSCNDREVGTRFLEGYFGKRPDIILTEGDVLELAKQGVSSFHVSEEHWKNPMQLAISTGKKDLDNFRKGWDLIFDIDCPNWVLSKRICHVIIKILKDHNIKSISCKFSGNKGFHIGVPFEAFPEKIQGKDKKLFFPDGVKRILEYIVFCAKKDYTDFILEGFNMKNLGEELHLKREELFREYCQECNSDFSSQNVKINYFCSTCGNHLQQEEHHDFIECKCGSIMRPEQTQKQKCLKCGASNIKKELNFELVLGLDEVLISSRHLYRMPFSLHEKSGLASIVIPINNVINFEKEMADPKNIKNEILHFMNTCDTVSSECESLIFKTLDYRPEVIKTEKKEFENMLNISGEVIKGSENNSNDIDKIPIECFPPSIINILGGIKDGKKRALFILLNFLDCVGWNYEDIEKIIFEWNNKNENPLKEGLIRTHLGYKKQPHERVMPPNYSNQNYYADLGVIAPEEQTGKIKNPVTYALKKSFFLNNKKGKRKSNKKPEGKKTKENSENNTESPEKIIQN